MFFKKKRIQSLKVFADSNGFQVTGGRTKDGSSHMLIAVSFGGGTK
jgi:hypothetical protein